MKYILVDWHGPADFNRTFREVLDTDRSSIDFYFYYSRETGGRTCKASCEHCFLMLDGAKEESISVTQAHEIIVDLQAEGYTSVGLTPSDSFSDELLASGDAGSAYRISGLGNTAWTSGAPLALEGWRERLNRGWEIGFRAIIMNGHDVAGTTVPFGGVTRKALLDRALANIRSWNTHRREGEFQFGLTFTIGAHNCDYVSLRTMANYALEIGCSFLRYNCFANFLARPEHAQYEQSADQIREMYVSIARVHTELIDQPISISVSEDFGPHGIEVIEPFMPPEYRGREVGNCRAGWRLFGITPVNGRLAVVGCVDRMAPYFGEVVRREGRWTIDWNFEHLEEFRQARLRGQLYGCFGGVGRNRPADAGFNSSEGNQLLRRLTVL